MINVSNDFKNRMKEIRNFKNYAQITFADDSETTLDSDEFVPTNSALSDGADDGFPIGVAVQKNVQLEIINDNQQYADKDFFGAKIRLYIDFQTDDEGTIERIEKGTYTVITPETYGETVIITAYDDMYKADKDYTTALTFPQTAGAVLRDICDTCGISLGSTTFLHDNFQIQNKPTGKFREVIGQIAMIACGNARIDRRNYLQIISYDFSGWEEEGEYHLLNEFTAPKIEYNDTEITGFKTIIKGETSEEDKEILRGTDTYCITIENPLISGQEHTVLSWLLEQIGNVPFRPFSGEAISNPLVEFMDLAKVQDRRANQYNTFITDVNFLMPGYTTLKNSTPSATRFSIDYTSASLKAEQRARQLVELEKKARELAVERLQEALANGSGLYPTKERQPDGSTIYYLHDKPTIKESTVVIKLTSDGIGISQNGGKDYPWGIMFTGEAILKLIYAIGINCDYLNAGAITVKDENGNVIFQVDMDTKKVNISGDSIIIGDKTLTERLSESNLFTIILNHEYQGIPTDSDGNYTGNLNVEVSVKAYYGGVDVSSDCSYIEQTSTGLYGRWNENSNSYTITDLDEDSGWVDITANYMDLFTSTKRFNVGKIKAGAQGAAGRTYFMEPSTLIVKRASDNSMAPNYITLSSYYRDGSSTARTAYAGRFKIEESLDGDKWTTVYTSASNESSITHSLYGALATSAGGAITSASNKTIGIPRDVVAIRCTLYAAGGTTQMLDMQTIAVAVDVDALTHEEIFNLLTNNGEIKGIYKEGNQLYISFTYAKGGQLVLGGVNNTSGVLKVLDADGNEIGSWDNTGISASGNLSLSMPGYHNGKIKTEVNAFTANIEGYAATRRGLRIFSENDKYDESVFITPSDGNGHGYGDGTYRTSSSILSSGELTIISGNNDTEVRNDISMEERVGSFSHTGIGGNGFSLVLQDSHVYMNCADAYGYGGGSQTMLTGNPGLSSSSISFTINGSVKCNGSKNRLVETKNYDKRLLYCYEMASPMFGDIGSGSIDSDGESYIYLDDIFCETISTKQDYQVFLQKEGEGDLWVFKKTPFYFAVKGTPNLNFAWEVKAIQKDYEAERLDNNFIAEEFPVSYPKDCAETLSVLGNIEDFIKEQEEILYETIE